MPAKKSSRIWELFHQKKAPFNKIHATCKICGFVRIIGNQNYAQLRQHLQSAHGNVKGVSEIVSHRVDRTRNRSLKVRHNDVIISCEGEGTRQFCLWTKLVESESPPDKYLKKGDSVQALVDELKTSADVYCVKDRKCSKAHDNATPSLVAGHRKCPIVLIVQIHQKIAYVIAASVKVQTNVDFLPYFDCVEPFLKPFRRSCVNSGKVYMFGCTYQPACNGCAFLRSDDASLERLRFPFVYPLPAKQRDIFKVKLENMSSAQAKMVKKIFPEADTTNTSSRDCRIGSTFTGITLISNAEHKAHRDVNDEGPTIVHNFTDSENETYLVFDDLELCTASGEKLSVFLQEENETLVTFFSQALKHSTKQKQGRRVAMLNFRHVKLDQSDHGRAIKRKRDEGLLVEEQRAIEQLAESRFQLSKGYQAGDISKECFEQKWSETCETEISMRKVYKSRRMKCTRKMSHDD